MTGSEPDVLLMMSDKLRRGAISLAWLKTSDNIQSGRNPTTCDRHSPAASPTIDEGALRDIP